MKSVPKHPSEKGLIAMPMFTHIGLPKNKFNQRRSLIGNHCANRRSDSCWPTACIPQKAVFRFSFEKVDYVTRVGLAGARYTLRSANGSVTTSISDAKGMVRFTVASCACYILTETKPPIGYAPHEASYQIFLDRCGRLFVNGVLTQRFVLADHKALVTASFTAVKVNILTGAPLEGVEFTLRQGDEILATAFSTATGMVHFTNIAPGTYQLEETAAPPGYQPSEPLSVNVTNEGIATINGLPAEGYRLSNIAVFRFAFFKVISGTTTGIPGATFRLTLDGADTGTAVSDNAGLVDFGVRAPGTYQLSETMPPDGYLPNENAYDVTIATDGGITVDGVPLEGFVAENTPIPVYYPYTVNYYATNISPENLLGTITSSGLLGDFIDVDLTLFAPPGYQTPGTRSGATYITDIPENNVVSVVYTRPLVSWYVEYYVYEPASENLLGRIKMPGVSYGTVVTLTPSQLDAYKPSGFQSGVQVGGQVAITVDGQVVYVVHLPLVSRAVTVNHLVEMAYGSGTFGLYTTTLTYAFDGSVIYSNTLAQDLGPEYSFFYASPNQLTVSSANNVISLYYVRMAS